MPTFDVDPETIRVFPMDDEYWFSHYFDRTDLFERLSEYYNDDEYASKSPPRRSGRSARSSLTSTSNSTSSRTARRSAS